MKASLLCAVLPSLVMMTSDSCPTSSDADGDGIPVSADCNDGNPAIFPGAADTACDGIDDNCDDVDGDGAPDESGDGTADCVDDDGDGFTEGDGDCDDQDASYYPHATETTDGGADYNCDGTVSFVTFADRETDVSISSPRFGRVAMHFPLGTVPDSAVDDPTVEPGAVHITAELSSLNDLSAHHFNGTQLSPFIRFSPDLTFEHSTAWPSFTFTFNPSLLNEETGLTCDWVDVYEVDGQSGARMGPPQFLIDGACDPVNGSIAVFMPHFSHYTVAGSTKAIVYQPVTATGAPLRSISAVHDQPASLYWMYQYDSGKTLNASEFDFVFPAPIAGVGVQPAVISSPSRYGGQYYPLSLAFSNQTGATVTTEVVVTSPSSGTLSWEDLGGSERCTDTTERAIAGGSAAFLPPGYDPGKILFECITVTIAPNPASVDDDGDTYAPPTDCDDHDPGRHPGAVETCNGRDDDCDGTIDELNPALVYYRDSDGDGYGGSPTVFATCPGPGYVTRDGDCNDGNAAAHPGGVEVCNGLDDDCDLLADEGVTRSFHPDSDGDGYGSPVIVQGCGTSEGIVTDASDCNDTDGAIHPGAPETSCEPIDRNCDGQFGSNFEPDPQTGSCPACNGTTPLQACDSLTGILYCPDTSSVEIYDDVDNDCDGNTDEGLDQDGDGYVTCALPGCPGDCDDTDRLTYPGATEVIGDGKDQSCDGGEICYLDADGDGFLPNGTQTVASADSDCSDPGEAPSSATIGDCNDASAAIKPGATEIPGDEIDQNCDSVEACYKDADDDGYRPGDGTTTITSTANLTCSDRGEAKATEPTGDCNDSSAATHPGATEIVGDEIDETCDTKEICYKDGDNDGYRPGSGTSTITSLDADCRDDQEAMMSEPTGDCKDTDGTIHPGATEVCDGIDQDCDTSKDEGVQTAYCKDVDGDGTGTSTGAPLLQCSSPGAGWVANCTDCIDNDPASHVGGAETCDFKDNDCDSKTDEGLPKKTYYADNDGDSWGGTTTGSYCMVPTGYATRGGDCGDWDPSIHPGAIEDCWETVDMDCDGLIGMDDPSCEGTICSSSADCSACEKCSDQKCGISPACLRVSGANLLAPAVDLFSNSPSVAHLASLRDGSICVGRKVGCIPTLRDAIEAATDGSVIWVEPGLYLEHDLDLTDKRISLRATAGSDHTIIDAEGQGRVLLFHNDGSELTVIDGFTLRGGQHVDGGGAVFIEDASPRLENLIIEEGRTAALGGAVLVKGGQPVFSNCVFRGNRASRGGAVAIVDAAPTFISTSISDNHAFLEGGGLYATRSNPVFINVAVVNNWATEGGGLYLEQAHLAATNTLVARNVGVRGGGMFVDLASPMFVATRFEENRAEFGAGLYVLDAEPSLYHSTVLDNRAEGQGGAVTLAGSFSGLQLNGAVIAFNEGCGLTVSSEVTSSLDITFSDLVDTDLGCAQVPAALSPTNLSIDPGFVSFESEGLWTRDLHLDPSSHLIDAGDPALRDVDGTRADIGLYGAWAGIGWDRDGDAAYDYPWAGLYDDAPIGTEASGFDPDDDDPALTAPGEPASPNLP